MFRNALLIILPSVVCQLRKDKLRNKRNIKMEFSTIKKQGINYLKDENDKIIKFKPWLGDIFSFLYDRIMDLKVLNYTTQVQNNYLLMKIFLILQFVICP